MNAADVMGVNVVTAKPGWSVQQVAMAMLDKGISGLPVIDQDDRLCGIVSLGDLSRETESDAASQALEGVSRPGGLHNQ